MWIIMDIGCIECGASSDIVGKFADKNQAEATASIINAAHGWQGEEHRFEIFELPELEGVLETYAKYLGDK